MNYVFPSLQLALSWHPKFPIRLRFLGTCHPILNDSKGIEPRFMTRGEFLEILRGISVTQVYHRGMDCDKLFHVSRVTNRMTVSLSERTCSAESLPAQSRERLGYKTT